MGIYTTKPIKEINEKEFLLLLKGRTIIISPHALWHLDNHQRKIFNVEELINMIGRESPRKVYLQENERYAVYYRKNDGYRKLVVELKDTKTIIVTFVDLNEIPKYDL